MPENKRRAQLENLNICLEILFKLGGIIGILGTILLTIYVAWFTSEPVRKGLINNAEKITATSAHYEDIYRQETLSGFHSGYFGPEKAKIDYTDPKPDFCWYPDFAIIAYNFRNFFNKENSTWEKQMIFYADAIHDHYLEVQFASSHHIHAIFLQGRGISMINPVGASDETKVNLDRRRQWVTLFRMSYSTTCKDNDFTPVIRNISTCLDTRGAQINDRFNDSVIFPGNSNSYEIARVDGFAPFSALCVRIHPVHFNWFPCMKLDFEGYREKSIFERFLKYLGIPPSD